MVGGKGFIALTPDGSTTECVGSPTCLGSPYSLSESSLAGNLTGGVWSYSPSRGLQNLAGPRNPDNFHPTTHTGKMTKASKTELDVHPTAF